MLNDIYYLKKFNKEIAIFESAAKEKKIDVSENWILFQFLKIYKRCLDGLEDLPDIEKMDTEQRRKVERQVGIKQQALFSMAIKSLENVARHKGFFNADKSNSGDLSTLTESLREIANPKPPKPTKIIEINEDGRNKDK